jgi:hypothetical protein
MPPASPLAIATSSVKRLVKEEASYHRELEQQTKRLQKLETEGPGNDDEGNHAFLVKQEVCLPPPQHFLSLAIVDSNMCIAPSCGGDQGDISDAEREDFGCSRKT